MATKVQGPAGLPPTGQPQPMIEGEFTAAACLPPLFGQRAAMQRGRPRTIVVPNPAASADWTYTHSGPSWFFLRALTAQLVTSVAGGTRIARLQVKQVGTLVAQLPPQASQAASLTVVYCGAAAALASGDAGTIVIPLPVELMVRDNMSVGANTTGLALNDQWSAIGLLIEEFDTFEWWDE